MGHDSARPRVLLIAALAGLSLLATLLAAVPTSEAQPGAKATNASAASQVWIVAVDADGEDQIRGIANRALRGQSAEVVHVYDNVINGFAARMSEQAAARLAGQPGIVSIQPDQQVSIANRCNPRHPKYDPNDPSCNPDPDPEPTPEPTPPPGGGSQQTPTGVARIGGPAAGPVDVDVAIIDTGISRHPDLNVVGGYNCTRGPSSNWEDDHGHGTHVAGTVGAVDNDFGVVGVAPGARLWAVKVLNRNGSGTLSDVICGIDWVASQSQIEVANMSLGGSRPFGDSCNDGGQRQAICELVDAGVTVVVAAGNSSADANRSAPAGYPEVITVSALTDSDGQAGGLGDASCRSTPDDSFADYSNWGSAVDVIAPGSCIRSTSYTGGYATFSGTSMASPHAAGAAALIAAANPGASPAQVQATLEANGNLDWDTSTDPDSTHESLIAVG